MFTRSRCKVAVLTHYTPTEPALARLRAGYKGRIEALDDLTQIDVGDEVIVRPIGNR